MPLECQVSGYIPTWNKKRLEKDLARRCFFAWVGFPFYPRTHRINFKTGVEKMTKEIKYTFVKLLSKMRF